MILSQTPLVDSEMIVAATLPVPEALLVPAQTFDDQDSGAYGGSSTQESRGFNTGNSGGLRDNEFGSSNSKYGRDLGDDRNNFGTSSSDRSYGGSAGSGLGDDTFFGLCSGYGDNTSSGLGNASTSRSGYGEDRSTVTRPLLDMVTRPLPASTVLSRSGYGDNTTSGLGGNTDSFNSNKTSSGNAYGSDDKYSSENTGPRDYDNTSSSNADESGDSTIGKVFEKAGHVLHKDNLVQKGEAKRAAAGNDNY
ncbi:hypothetical protein DID88_003742 [Monilinia fructigena]|uniref:Uncharacterized protein n=1 Tax=Monilinia fructigena TaxID=38457 RepID=A0A395ITR0_9HELO|nr:hypothetical protein DID88_003742 [Monilinia fructigena]